MKILKPMVRLSVVGAMVIVLLASVDAQAKKPTCPRTGINCLDVWDPVICDDGQVYSNSCYAYVACATGCEPYGDGGVYEFDKAAPCDRPKVCPKLWAPVICDDGKVYPNDCYAQKKCATGCEPYGEWLMGGNEDKAAPCDRPKFCPALWAPVICDDGKVYANDCYAQKKCATGCVPYDEGLALDGDKKKPIDDGCPRIGWMCPDVWDPVICDGDEVYSNSCYAWVACATGCEPYGDGGMIVMDKATCVRPKICPKLWAPVICDDGKVYPNDCYAQKKCATGCEPYWE